MALCSSPCRGHPQPVWCMQAHCHLQCIVCMHCCRWLLSSSCHDLAAVVAKRGCVCAHTYDYHTASSSSFAHGSLWYYPVWTAVAGSPSPVYESCILHNLINLYTTKGACAGKHPWCNMVTLILMRSWSRSWILLTSEHCTELSTSLPIDLSPSVDCLSIHMVMYLELTPDVL